MSPDRERWQQVRSLFEAVLDLPSSERESRLARIGETDPTLIVEIRELLAADARAEGETPTRTSSPGSGENLTGRQIGSYRLLRLIATGGMGRVYEAEQEEPRRRVALKTMHHGLASETERRRFRWECEVLARLHHPGIAQIHEAGTFAGTSEGEAVPFFAMELVEGARSLIEHADAQHLSLGDRLRLFMEVCDAVAHGHARGVIHRDLKPANVLVDAAGRPKIIDFGIARALDRGDASTRFTETGHLVGTLPYMAPEQVAGEPADVRCDVYALGVLLCELLTGRLPLDLRGISLPEAARRVVQEGPRRLRELDSSLPLELEWIVQRALAAEPERRYESPLALAADLRRLLAHEPITAGPESLGYRARKFVRRHRVAVAAASLIAISLIGGVVGTGLGMKRANEQRLLAEERLAEVQAEQRTTQRALDHFIRTLTAVDPRRDGREARLIDAVVRGAESIDRDFPDDPAIRERLHHAAGTILSALALPEQAEHHLMEARRIALTLQREPEHVLLGRLGPLVLTWLRLGKLEEAEELARRILESCQLHLGPDHYETADASQDLAAVLRARGQLAQSEAAYRTAARGFARLGEVGAGERRVAENGLAACLLDRRRFTEAKSVLGPLLVELESIPPAETNRQLLTSVLNNLAVVRLEEGRLDEAEVLVERAIATASSALGERHPETLRVRYNRGRLLAARGRTDEAETCWRSMIEETDIERPGAQVEVFLAMSSLARSLWQRGVLAEALRLNDAARQGLESWLGALHRQTLSVRGRGAAYRIESDEAREALRELEEVWVIQTRELGPDDEETLTTESNLGVALLRLGEDARAAEHHRHVLDVRLEQLGESHPDTLQAMNNLAAALQDLNRLDEAEALYRRSITLREERGESGHPQTQIARNNLATLLSARGDVVAAERCYRELYEERRAVHGESDPSTIHVLNNIAVMRQRQDDLDGAAELYERVLAAATGAKGVTPFRRANYAFNAAVCFQKLGRYERAEPLMLEALAVLREQRGLDDEITRDAIEVLREIYAAWPQAERAAAFEKGLRSGR